MMREAFRILLGKLEYHRSVLDHHKKELEYVFAVQQLLKPLGISNRLNFFRHSDPTSGVDWLVVKVESSGQLPLIEEIGQDLGFDFELCRECDAAEHQISMALKLLRKLMSLAQTSPTDFHRLLDTEKEATSDGLRMMNLAKVRENGIVVVRNPQGSDNVARLHAVPNSVTMPDVHEKRYLIEMVGRSSAMVSDIETGGKQTRRSAKTIEIFWGNVPKREELIQYFYKAMLTRELVSIRARETLNRRGMISRLELFETVF